jgi:hypothetical protein
MVLRFPASWIRCFPKLAPIPTDWARGITLISASSVMLTPSWVDRVGSSFQIRASLFLSRLRILNSDWFLIASEGGT